MSNPDEPDEIQAWADAHDLTREQAEKLVTMTDEGLVVDYPPYKWAKILAA